MLKVLLAGGGTAGHINPALAIASIITVHNPGAEFLFAGTPFGMEAKLIPQAGYDFSPIKVSGFQRRLSVKNIGRNIKSLAYLTTAGNRAKQIIKGFDPDIVIGTGGYVSGPVLLKAAQMGIPTAIHEANAYPGVTTRLLAKKVDRIMLTVKETQNYLEKGITCHVTGLPVRKGFEKNLLTRAEAKRQLGFDSSMCILSFGGSLGAGGINKTVPELIKWETDGGLPINHIHGYGQMGRDTFENELTEKIGNYKENKRLIIKEYLHNIDVCTAAADLIICRSGASTISELEAAGRASILIPSPAVTGNHQYHNAMVLGKAGAAVVIEQKNLTGDILIEKVRDFYENQDKLYKFAKRAHELYIKDTGERIYAVINELISGNKDNT